MSIEWAVQYFITQCAVYNILLHSLSYEPRLKHKYLILQRTQLFDNKQLYADTYLLENLVVPSAHIICMYV